MSNKINPVIKWLALLFIVLMGGMLLVAIISDHASGTKAVTKTTFINDNATSDTPVETLKTLTAEVSTVEQQNQTLVAQNKSLIAQDKTALAKFKEDVLADMQKQVDDMKAQQAISHQPANQSPAANPSSNNRNNSDYVINSGNDTSNNETNNQWVWVQDLRQNAATPDSQPNTDINSLLTGTAHPSQPKLSLTSQAALQAEKKIQPVPYYTIPVNATLTRAIAMQPIIGRIPIDGKVVDPYTFKVIIGAKNLAANGIDIPSDIQGIVASGIAKGDMLGKCARGDITSLTFIFWDGRISTTQAKDGQSLGSIAAANGNPCIAGIFHSDAALYLGAEAGLAGLQGYGNALSQAQMSNSTSAATGASIATLIGSANKYAFGQGFAASAQAAQRWWDQRVQSSFDFIYVPNVDLKTGKKLELNINITQEIPIDYDPQGRKVFYDHQIIPFTAARLD